MDSVAMVRVAAAILSVAVLGFLIQRRRMRVR